MQKSHARGLVPFMAIVLGGAMVASANVGTGLPLDQYQVGSETTSNAIVTNGGFNPGAPDGALPPTGWTQQGSFGTGPAIGPNSQTTNGSVAQGPLGAADPTFPAVNGYNQLVTLAPNTNYVLSAYMWNFGSNFDLIGAELRAGTGLDGAIPGGANIYLTRNDGSGQNPGLVLDGSRGVFGFSGFNSGAGGTFNLIVKFDEDSSGDPAPFIGGQLDNIAITPAVDFRPVQVPEPAFIGLAAAAGLALIRRR